MRISEAKDVVKAVFDHNLGLPDGSDDAQYIVPYLESSPGVGKTSIVKQIAHEMKAELIDVRMAQSDPTSLAGWDIPNEERTKMTRIPPRWFPEDGGKITILYLDEFPQAMVALQNIGGQIVNERQIGPFKFPRNVLVVAAGNAMKDKAGTTRMPTQVVDRFTHISITPDVNDTIRYFTGKGVSPEIIGYLKWKPDMLSKFQTDVTAFPSPRSWERSNAILSLNLPEGLTREALMGQIGEAAATDFYAYVKLASKLPAYEDIIADPKGTPVPNDPGMIYAVAANLAMRVTDKDINAVLDYIDRMKREEINAYVIIEALYRDGAKTMRMADNPRVGSWLLDRGMEIISKD